jgi:hypothetical protein
MMIDELIHDLPNPTFGIKIALSLYKDKMPWIYEEGISILNKVSTSKNHLLNRKLFAEFEQLLMMSTRHPFMEEFFIDSEDEYILFKELPRVVLRGLERVCHQRENVTSR